MNVLVFGTLPSPLAPILEEHDRSVVECADPIDVEYLKSNSIEFAVSYRYRHIIRKPIIEYLRGNVINLHVSLLPWTRGSDPNLWSFLENTPKGVTIHYVDEGLDTGDIIAQKEVVFDTSAETLSTTYDRLNVEIVELFRLQWPLIMQSKADRRKQPFGGSFHKVKDKEQFAHLLAENGWDTTVEKLVGKALK